MMDRSCFLKREKKVLVIIPAFNEASSIVGVVRGVKQSFPEADILVVDDGSKDATGELARQEGAGVVRLPFNLGVGAALQTGYRYALRYAYEFVVQLDADGQHDPLYLPELLRPLSEDQVDLVIGSRFLERSRFPGSWTRLVGIKIFAFLTWLATGQRLTDPTSGYRAMRRSVVEFFCSDFFPHDYPDADVLITTCRAGFRLKEIPVVMKERLTGCSLHRGLKPFYYIYKMFLSILVSVLRQDWR